MDSNLEQQPAAVAEQTTVDQDKCGGDGDMAPKSRVRMHPDDVRFTLSLKPEDLGGTEYLDRFAHKLTPDELEEHRRVHEEVAAIFRKDDELEARQAQVARELAEKGYVETDEVDPVAEAEYEKWAAKMWKTMTDKPLFKRAEFADPHDVVEGAPGWTVRPFDAEEDEDYEEDETEDEDEYEYDDEKVEAKDEDKVEAKDEDEQDEVGDEKEDTAALESN